MRLKNKTALVLAAAFGASLGCAISQEAPETILPGIERSGNSAPRIPASVHYEQIEEKRHVVTIDGIAGESLRAEGEFRDSNFVQTPMDYVPGISGLIDFEVDHNSRKCRIITSRKIELSELSVALNKVAKVRSDIPCWAELEARDIEHAKDFRDDRYRLEKIDDEFPTGLAWFWLLGSQGFSAPMIMKSSSGHAIFRGKLLVVPTPVPKGDQSRYVVRLLDQSENLIWMSSSTANGVVRIAVGDADEDGEHEVYLGCNENEGERRFCIKP